MAAAPLHDSLKYLSPTTWSEVPLSNLEPYLTSVFTAAELLINSVPPPPSGTPFDTAQPQFTTPNSAKSAKDVHSSSARPAAPDTAHADLQKHWGKPMKFGQKENPLNVALYKMAGHDRHGAWFARHQVLEGIGFEKFRKALMREFPETLLVQGQPGAGAKRGLSGERRVERIDVDGVGRVEVYQLSAQMPSPVSPRDFLTLLLTTEKGLTEKSAAEGADGNAHLPRNYMIISRPLDHPDAPQRTSFVRGQYESVELIREIPLHVSKSTADLNKQSSETIDPELNPVEWIMVTRSDPAGGVPRFLVDRGTPGAMLTDVTKFLNWACAYEEVPDADSDLSLQLQKSKEMTEKIRGEQEGTVRSTGDATADTTTIPNEAPPQTPEPTREVAPLDPTPETLPSPESQGRIVSNLSQSLATGVNSYAPAPVAGFMNRQLGTIAPLDDDLSDSSDSSLDSFLSAEEIRRMSTAPEDLPRASTENISIASAASSSEISKTSQQKSLSTHEKEMQKLTRQREKLDQKLAKKRELEQEKLRSSQEKEEADSSKARERMEKEMKKTEERHRKEIEKLEAKRERQTKKVEERRKKREEGDKLSLVARERDEFRGQAELLRRENAMLMEQVESLQKENTVLAGRVGKLGGADALKDLQGMLGSRSRTGTLMGENGGSSGSLEKGG